MSVLCYLSAGKQKTDTMQLKQGSLLKRGEYRIEKVIGQGGFGITYLAEQTSLGRKVAVKEFFMKEHCNRESDTLQVSVPSVGSRELVERYRQKFMKEARLIASFDNGNITRIYDVFEDNGTAYYVMEYLEGKSLKAIVEEEGPLAEDVALGYIRQIAGALREIHGSNLLHLDVKPANIMLNKKGEAVLIDFGISKHYDENGAQTSSASIGISEGYAPLEQYDAGIMKAFAPTTDIYAVGATLFFLLTGKRPPKASEVMNFGLPELPARISSITRQTVTAAMQPVVRMRPQSIDEFLDKLKGENGNLRGHNGETRAGIEQPMKKTVGSENSDDVVTPPFEVGEFPKDKSKGAEDESDVTSLNEFPSSVSSFENVEEAPGISGNDTGRESKKPVLTILCVVLLLAAALVAFLFIPGTGSEENAETAEGGAPVSVQKSCAQLTVTTVPSEATVYVDGTEVGFTPLYSYEVEEGRHSIKICKEGYYDVVRNYEFGNEPIVIGETLNEDNLINGHEFVDLGLSVKWAVCNVGTDRPEGGGDLYAWGETETKSSYTEFNSITFDKRFGNIGGDSQYDAARNKWGGSWRLPTNSEWQELIDNCTWQWTSRNGVNGYKVTSNRNSRSIFLPAIFSGETSPCSQGDYGAYWSSTPDNYESFSNALYMYSGTYYTFSDIRYYGYCVRPVTY